MRHNLTDLDYKRWDFHCETVPVVYVKPNVSLNLNVMQKWKLQAFLLLTIVFFCSIPAFSQTMDWTKQVITVNSGRFEFAPPIQDYVTAQTFNLSEQTSSEFNTIFTQSAQDILVSGNIAYVNAQDSIIKYNLNTFQRVAAIADSGLGKLAIYNNRLIVSKQYPLSRYFVEVLDTTDLSIIAQVDDISGDCSGIAVTSDTVYVAVNGGWMGTEGKIAVIDPSTWTMIREINFGAEAVGIYNLYAFGGKIYSVNKTPYGMPAIGSISIYDPSNGSHINKMIGVKVGNGTGIKDAILYVMMNEGIGSFNLTSLEIEDTTIVSDPGSAMFMYILSSLVDTINDRLYSNIGDFMTPGYCLVSDLTGDSITSYPTGISSDVVGIDYRAYPIGIADYNNDLSLLSIYPNPCAEKITLSYTGKQHIGEIMILDVYGKSVYNQAGKLSASGKQEIAVGELPSGLYCLVLKTSGNPVIAKFIKH